MPPTSQPAAPPSQPAAPPSQPAAPPSQPAAPPDIVNYWHQTHEALRQEIFENLPNEALVLLQQELAYTGKRKEILKQLATWTGTPIEHIRLIRRSQDYKDARSECRTISFLESLRTTKESVLTKAPDNVDNVDNADNDTNPAAADNLNARPLPVNSVDALREAVAKSIEFLHATSDAVALSVGSDTPQTTRADIVDSEYAIWSSQHLQVTIPSTTGPKSRKPPKRDPATLTRKQRRKREYKYIQRLYAKNKSRVVDEITSGAYKATTSNAIPVEDLFQFWGNTMGQPSTVDNRCPRPKSSTFEELISPIDQADVTIALRGLHNSAPGPDGVCRKHLQSCDPRDLAAHFNWWLLSTTPPSSLKSGKIKCIPKNQNPQGPAETRPITMCSIVGRLFHRILAGRLERCWPLDDAQKAFRSGDGLGSNVWMLKTVMNHHWTTRKRLNLVFLDIRKAFDSVSHNSIRGAMERMGSPPLLVKYVANLLEGTTGYIEAQPSCSPSFPILRGVKQGDPLSPLLFNAAIDWAVEALDSKIGVSLPHTKAKLSYLAFADDLVLFSESDRGLQTQISALTTQLATMGLELNPAKCGSYRLRPLGKEKKIIVDPHPFLMVDQVYIPALPVDASYTYLGIQVGFTNPKIPFFQTLRDRLQRFTSSPLHPKQRLHLLRHHIIPSYIHSLTFSRFTKAVLLRSDQAIRAAIRDWMQLPQDTPSAMFHAAPKDGGFGIPSLVHWTPSLIYNRLRRLFSPGALTTQSTLLGLLIVSPLTNSILAAAPDSQSQQSYWARVLYQKFEGRGLQNASDNVLPSKWLTCPEWPISGQDFIKCVHVRAASLHNKLKASRGQVNPDPMCRVGCTQHESLQHILQVCPRTAGVRSARHDAINVKVSKALEERGFTVVREPRIRTAAGIRIPDVCAWGPDVNLVLDSTVVSDVADLRTEFDFKAAKYNVPEIREWMRTRAVSPSNPTIFTGLVMTWRGVMAKESFTDLHDVGIPRHLVEFWSMDTLLRGHQIWRTFLASTYRLPGRLTSNH